MILKKIVIKFFRISHVLDLGIYYDKQRNEEKYRKVSPLSARFCFFFDRMSHAKCHKLSSVLRTFSNTLFIQRSWLTIDSNKTIFWTAITHWDVPLGRNSKVLIHHYQLIYHWCQRYQNAPHDHSSNMRFHFSNKVIDCK